MDPTIIIAIGGTFVAVSLLVVGVHDVGTNRQLVSERIRRYDPMRTMSDAEALASGGTSVLRDQRLSSFTALDNLLRGSGLGEGMALDLARASISLRVGEYVLLRLVTALVVALVPMTAGQPLLVTAVAAAVGFYLPKLYVSRREQARVRKFNDQLVDATTMIGNSLKAGFSLIQGLELVSREMPSPMSEEISQALGEMALGSSAEDALVNLSKRITSYDLDLIVTAMLIQREVGGNLAEVLNNISHTIRERIRMKNEVHALTGEVRISAYILGGLPIFIMMALTVLNRSYLMDLLTTPIGQMMLAVGAVLEVIGLIMMRRLAAIEV